jgi:hypothetical protein
MHNLLDRMTALEQQVHALEQHTHIVRRRVRWWRGIACGVVMLALLSLALPSGKAADTQPQGMAERMATLEHTLSAMAFDDAANEVVITGANLRIVNGMGNTRTTNGLGNLIVGYNELRNDPNIPDVRTGSHNAVVGRQHNFSSFGGLVVGDFNEISGQFASVSGGRANIAAGDSSSISGGSINTIRGIGQRGQSAISASICGGVSNTASGNSSAISGGLVHFQ